MRPVGLTRRSNAPPRAAPATAATAGTARPPDAALPMNRPATPKAAVVRRPCRRAALGGEPGIIRDLERNHAQGFHLLPHDPAPACRPPVDHEGEPERDCEQGDRHPAAGSPQPMNTVRPPARAPMKANTSQNRRRRKKARRSLRYISSNTACVLSVYQLSYRWSISSLLSLHLINNALIVAFQPDRNTPLNWRNSLRLAVWMYLAMCDSKAASCASVSSSTHN